MYNLQELIEALEKHCIADSPTQSPKTMKKKKILFSTIPTNANTKCGKDNGKAAEKS